jgi:hypothetical protein
MWLARIIHPIFPHLYLIRRTCTTSKTRSPFKLAFCPDKLAISQKTRN